MSEPKGMIVTKIPCTVAVGAGGGGVPPAKVTGPGSGDSGFYAVLEELEGLHARKAADYGTKKDALANYVQASEAAGEPDEYVCWLRIIEKAHRALNLIRAGRANDNHEGPDVAALAIGAEALRRRRL